MNVFKRHYRNKHGVLIESKTWYGEFTPPGKMLPKRINLKCREKATAMKLLTDIVSKAERRFAGLLPTEGESACIKMSIGDLIDEFTLEKDKTGRSYDYTRVLDKRLNKLAKECHWKTLRDIEVGGFLAWRRKQGTKSVKTLNEYRHSLVCFLNWIKKRYRVDMSHIQEGIEPIDKRGQETIRRRALSVEEVRRLLEIAPPRRRFVYLIAVTTGLRRREIEALCWGDIILDCERPYLKLQAKYTKNRQNATIILAEPTATAFRNVRPADAEADTPVLSYRIPQNERGLYLDMEKAGIPRMVNGERFDFHSLRGTVCTYLHSINTPPRVIQEFMRHSDIKLTMQNYTDVNNLPVANSIAKLSSLVPLDCTRKLTVESVKNRNFESNFVTQRKNKKREKGSKNALFLDGKSDFGRSEKVAEGVGFEPTKYYSYLSDFESGAFSRSAIPPQK